MGIHRNFLQKRFKEIGDSSNIDITGDEFKKFVYGKWAIAPERRMKEFNHSAMFPEELVNRALKLFSFKNDIVLDPFNGVGTTTKVAKKLHGTEIEKLFNEYRTYNVRVKAIKSKGHSHSYYIKGHKIIK